MGHDEDDDDDDADHARLVALCDEFENLCHELRYHQKECVPSRPRPSRWVRQIRVRSRRRRRRRLPRR